MVSRLGRVGATQRFHRMDLEQSELLVNRLKAESALLPTNSFG